jgi:hypothetical protein
MQGLMGEGQPWARYDDMFCGWASKVVGDHIGVGTKSGAPYIHHNKASNPFTNLKKEYKGLFWQEDAIKFFQNVKLSEHNTDAASAYKELSQKVKDNLSYLNPYFNRLGDAMSIWVDLWNERNIKGCVQGNCPPKLLPVASRSSHGPKHPDSSCAIFTVTHNEKLFLPIWLRYYTRHAHPEDIWVLDHNTTDGSTSPEKIPAGVNYKKLFGDAAFMPHHFLNRQVELHQQRLFRYGYKCVLFTEIDEMFMPDPAKYPGGLKEYLSKFAADPAKIHYRGAGYEIVQKTEGDTANPAELTMDWSKNIMAQRHFWAPSPGFSKPLLSKIPITYLPGFHSNVEPPVVAIDPDLKLVHLHSSDATDCFNREKAKFEGSKQMHKEENGLGIHFSGGFEAMVADGTVCLFKAAKSLKSRSFSDYGKVENGIYTMDERWHAVEL